MILKINPRDVVSIPSDYENTKGRTCKYEVIGEHELDEMTHAFESSVYDEDYDDEEDDYGNEWEEYEDEYEDEPESGTEEEIKAHEEAFNQQVDTMKQELLDRLHTEEEKDEHEHGTDDTFGPRVTLLEEDKDKENPGDVAVS
jgi:hypothetical protein